MYQTRAPYLGPWVEARVLPFREVRGPLAGLGLLGRYSRGFVQTHIIGVGSAGAQWSSDQSFGLALVYAHAFRQAFAQPQVAIALGVHHRTFTVATNPVLPSSNRQLAPEASLEGRVVLVPRWASLRVRAGAIFLAAPGKEERALFGEQSVSSWGAKALASLEGQLPGSRWGYALAFDHQAFFDRFEGSGLSAAGGAAVEQYSSVALSTRYAF